MSGITGSTAIVTGAGLSGAGTALSPLVSLNPNPSTFAAAVGLTGAAVDFTSIPSWVKKITVSFQQLSTNGGAAKLIQLGYSGGIETSGYVAAAQLVSPAANVTRSGVFTNGFPLEWSTGAASDSHTGTIIFVNEYSNVWTCVGNQIFEAGGGHFISGRKTTSGVLDRIRITTANGTDAFDAGTANIIFE